LLRPLGFNALPGSALAGLPPAREGFLIASTHGWERDIVAGLESTGHGCTAASVAPTTVIPAGAATSSASVVLARSNAVAARVGQAVVGIVLKLASRDVPPPGAGRACARTYGGYAEALRAKTAPAASESPAQGRQFYADETPTPGDRRRSGEIASGSLPFTFTGDRFSAPCNNNSWFGSRPISGPSFTISLLMVTSSSSSVTSS
jgi:hypothetical protein